MSVVNENMMIWWSCMDIRLQIKSMFYCKHENDTVCVLACVFKQSENVVKLKW